jgi:hypothetical protein
MGRSVAESPAEKRPQEYSEVIVLFRYVLAVRLLVKSPVVKWGCPPWLLEQRQFPRGKATNTWSISPLDPMEYTLRFGGYSVF